MNLPSRRRHLVLGAAALTALAAWRAPALSQSPAFPDRAITLVVPFPAGGATDTVVRRIATGAAQALGVPVVIDNKPGASGMLGAHQMVNAAPDGHTLSVLPEAALRLPHLQPTLFNPLRDFSYIIQLCGYCLGVAVRADAPWGNWEALVMDARRRPRAITYGTTGQHGSMHLVMEQIAAQQGVALYHVPFKGETEIIQALVGGHIDLGLSAGTIAPLVDAGQARWLLLWTRERQPRWPQVPVLSDVGLPLTATAPFGIVGPKGLPAAITQRLHAAFRAGLMAPETRTQMERLLQVPAYLDSAGYERAARQTFEAAGRQLAAMGVKTGS